MYVCDVACVWQGWATDEVRSEALRFMIDLVYSRALPRDMREQVLDALWLAISRRGDSGGMPEFRTREFDDLVRCSHALAAGSPLTASAPRRSRRA